MTVYTAVTAAAAVLKAPSTAHRTNPIKSILKNVSAAVYVQKAAAARPSDSLKSKKMTHKSSAFRRFVRQFFCIIKAANYAYLKFAAFYGMEFHGRLIYSYFFHTAEKAVIIAC